MAEGTNKVLCKYLLSNACKKGSACEFSHNKQEHRPSNVCQHYLEGTCTYGSGCRYDHDKSFKKTSKNALVPSKVIPNPLKDTSHPLAGHNTTSKTFTTLASSTTTSSSTFSNNIPSIKSSMPLNWALAPEFKPRNFKAPTYSTAVQNNMQGASGPSYEEEGRKNKWMDNGMNEGMTEGTIQFILCEFCSLYYNPNDLTHQKDCERAMERHQRQQEVIEVSSTQTCGICLDVVWQKETMSRQRFGLLSGCNHVFCLDCIRKWRKNNSADDDALRSCPVCRTHTDFVVPSYHWFIDQTDKENIITKYKTALKIKPCKYFKESATCPFGDDCFYSHKDKNGKTVLNVKKTRRYKVDEGGESVILLTSLLSEFFQFEEALREYVDDIGDMANDSDYGIYDDDYDDDDDDDDVQLDQELLDIVSTSDSLAECAFFRADESDSDDDYVLPGRW